MTNTKPNPSSDLVIVCVFHDRAIPVVKMEDGKWVIASAARGIRISHGVCEICSGVMREKMRQSEKEAV